MAHGVDFLYLVGQRGELLDRHLRRLHRVLARKPADGSVGLHGFRLLVTCRECGGQLSGRPLMVAMLPSER